jgi:autotransporter-associated beta strand protein
MTFSTAPINHSGDLVLENSGVGSSISAAGEVRINSAIGADVTNVTIRNTTTGTRGAQAVLFAFEPKLYTGTTTINAGARLETLAANLIPDSSAVTVDGTLDLRSFSETIGALNGVGTITRTTTSDTLTIGSGNSSGNFSGTIQNGTSGSLFLLKTGTGTQELSGANSHIGGTTVSQGALRVSNVTGSATGSGSVKVFADATLTGSGAIAGDVNVGGTLDPGSQIGTLTVGGDFTLSTGGILRIGINDAATSKNDRLNIGGKFTIEDTKGDVALDFEVTGTPTQPVYIVASYTGTPPVNLKATNVPQGYIVDFAFEGNKIALISPYREWAEDVKQGLTKGMNDGKFDDPNRNGIPNLLEFATNGNPVSAKRNGGLRKELADVDPGASVSVALTVTLPVRKGAIFAGPGDLVSESVDGIVYRIEASGDLVDFTSPNVTEITDNAHIISTLGIQEPSPGWTLRTFRAPGAPGSTIREFIRVGVE